MRRLNKKVLVILILITLILGIVLIFATTKATEVASKILLVATVIDFIALTFLIQAFGFQSFKPKKMKYPEASYKSEYEYQNLDEVLIKEGFKKTKRIYGNNYLFINKKVAIKVSLIDDYQTYFQNEENTNNTQNKELEKCEKFVGIEIFKEIDEANLEKLPLFTIQGKNVYFTALLYQNDKLYKCLNKEEPLDDFTESFNLAMNVLKMKEEDDLNVGE